MQRAICVFSSSVHQVDGPILEAARELGAGIARRGWTLVYGGTDVGLMGAVARAAHAHGGRVVGVIPVALRDAGIAYDRADQLIVTRDMRERKAVMDRRSDAFVALPGGFGTLEEVFEIITLKQLGYHRKPIGILNIAGYYDPLQGLFEHIYERGFARTETRELYRIVSGVPGLLEYV
ncbi:MAG TPA: TIGR00730 family Rossman fold protein, partial [Bacillota bacterium]